MSSTMFNIGKQINSVTDFGLGVCIQKVSASIAAGVNTQVTVPSTTTPGIPSSRQTPGFQAVINTTPAAEVWFAVNANATVPAGAAFAATNSELISGKASKFVLAGDVLNFLCGPGCDVSVEFYSVQY